MGKMKELARDMKNLEAMVSVCTRCGTCQAHCPLYAQTRKETDVSRGKIALLTGLAEEMFKDPKGVDERLNRCLLCGACAKFCPSGVDTQAIFIRARSILTRYLGLSFAKKMIFRRYLAHPHKFDKFMGKMAKLQSLALVPEENTQATSCSRLDIPLLRDRHLTPLAPIPFRNQVIPAADKEGPRVVFFTGCLIDKALPQVGMAAVEVLHHFGCQVIIPENQGCCGIPALASGDHDTALALVRHHLELFRDFEADALVTACATCTATLKKQWPVLARELVDEPAPGDSGEEEEINWGELAWEWAGKTFDISQFLASQFDLSFPVTGDDSPEAVTYHDPCHLKKSLDISQEPRDLITACGHELVEMERPDHCCGMGGSFNLAHYDLSSQIGGRKAEDIEATGASIVTTSCPACMMQLTDMLARRGSEIGVHHVVEVYARQLMEGPKDPEQGDQLPQK